MAYILKATSEFYLYLVFLWEKYLKQKCFPGNLKIKIFYSTSQIFRKYNHQTGFLYNDGGGGLCLQNSSLVWVLFAIGFVCFLVGGYFWYLVCVFVGWWLFLVFGLCVG